MSDSVSITIKGIPPSLNRTAGRQNVWEYRKNKELWTKMVYMASKACKDRPSEPFQYAVVDITYYFPDKRRRDADNYSGKFLLDGLTKAGVIVDDDLKHITTVISGDYDKKNPRTEIVVLRDFIRTGE